MKFYNIWRRLIGSKGEWEIVLKSTNSRELYEVVEVLKKFEPEYEYKII